MRGNIKFSISIALFLFLFANQWSGTVATPSQCKAWLVQSIPTDMPHLRPVSGVLSTSDVLQWLAGNSTTRLDIIAQYWQLHTYANNTQSGDYGYTRENLKRLGAQQGSDVYKSIVDAADRNISIRLLQHSGVAPSYTKEPDDIASGRLNVNSAKLLLEDYFGSGIVHAKVWISDGKHAYIGSANNDWKSLTQVKELGIYIVECKKIVSKIEEYMESLWTLAHVDSEYYTTTVFDEQWQINRKVPCWSNFVQSKQRCRPPMHRRAVEVSHVRGYPILSDPRVFNVYIETPGREDYTLEPPVSYLSFSPPELSFGKFQTDEQAWIETIKSVGEGETVMINTMDWLGQSQYIQPTVYWSSLSSAISEVVFTKHATVKILVAYWAHFIPNTEQYLKSLIYSNVLCSSSKYNNCTGKVEIKYYVVPGYNLTGRASKSDKSTGNIYPGFTRVNHGKYAVTDVRAHIGTSNLVWDYFYTTAGISFGTYCHSLVLQLQEIFEADWNSPYAVPIDELATNYYIFAS